MPGFAQQSLGVGYPPTLDFQTPPTSPAWVPGTVLWAQDAYLGGGAFMYAKAAAAQAVGTCVYFGNANGDVTATAIPNTANQGFPVGFARQKMAGSDYGWYQVHGVCPAVVTASVAAGVAIGITGAGTLGTVAAGKQILNAQVLVASTGTITKPITTSVQVGKTKLIEVPNINGLWIGQAVSGTGVGASAVITAIDPSGNFISVDVASTAAGTVTGTFTYTGFVLLRIAFPFAQGQIA